MNADRASAAGQGGTPYLPPTEDLASETQDDCLQPSPQETLPPLSSDERHRQTTAEELAGYLADGRAMFARCKALSEEEYGDTLGPILAATKLMSASAQLARVLAQVTLVERRSRTIVETIQPLKSKNRQLNSTFQTPEELADSRAALEKRLDELLVAARKHQAKMEDEAIGCCI